MLVKDNISSDLQFTGERYVPNIGGDIELEHLHRYRIIEAMIAGKIVADIACGEGYGSNLMARYAAKVIGVDISLEAVEHAQREYKKDNLTFVCAPGQDTKIAAHSIDVVVSFETIEHHDKHQEMLLEIKRVLKPGGVLIMSSPDKLECTDKTGVKNPHHVKELYKSEFEALIQSQFKNSELYGQRVITGSAIFAQGMPAQIRSYNIDKIEEHFTNIIEHPLYWIAVASDSPLDHLPGGMLEVDVSIDSLRLAEYENEIRKKTIEQRDIDVLTIQKQIAVLEGNFQSAQAQLSITLEQLKSSHEQLKSSHEQLKSSHEQLKGTQLQLSSTELDLLELSEQLNDAQKDNQRLSQRNQDLISSTSWRLTSPLRFIKHLLTGDWAVIGQIVRFYLRKARSVAGRLIPSPITRKLEGWKLAFNRYSTTFDSSMNQRALDCLVASRFLFSQKKFAGVAKNASTDVKEYPPIDISLVTYNSGKWLKRFFDSMQQLQYPPALLNIYVLDNGSTDTTVSQLYEAQKTLQRIGMALHIAQGPNVGFGAGHNHNIKLGRAPLLLVSNVDLFFEPDALQQVMTQAMQNDETVAAWEFRQKPYEHPKYYDPVTGLTNWNSHACVLLRRKAINEVRGYDENIFMYGEDVDLSYNLRAHGYFLKYCAKAVVWHDTYESADQVKPLQYAGSTFASLYLRLKYGTLRDVVSIPALHRLLSNGPSAYPGAQADIDLNGKKLTAKTLGALIKRKQTNALFPFRGFDYDLTRAGAFYKLEPIPSNGPLVSVVTRTYQGRTAYLRDAILSVANQTYPNIEHIIVEDGGSTQQALCQNAAQTINPHLRYISLDKVGRCTAGNQGLEAAKGRYCMFLDDDDLLFADHIEVLLNALLKASNAVAAYSPAMEIHTDVIDKNTGEYIETQHSFPAGLFQEYSFSKLRLHNYIAIQSILFDRQLYEQRGGFDVSLDYLEDWNLWVRYGWNNTFEYVPKLTSMYRVPSSVAEFQRRSDLLNGAYVSVCQSNADALKQLEMSCHVLASV